MKKLFDTDYDENGDESKYFADLQEEVDSQTRTNKEFFADEAHRERYKIHFGEILKPLFVIP